MNLMMGLLAALGNMRSITVSSNWGNTLDTSPVTSPLGILDVPSGNPGSVRFEIITNTGTLEYSLSGAAYTTVTDGGTISVSDGSTLRFKLTGVTAECSLEVYDNTTGSVIGTWTATETT
jgi:hypothetical protein